MFSEVDNIMQDSLSREINLLLNSLIVIRQLIIGSQRDVLNQYKLLPTFIKTILEMLLRQLGKVSQQKSLSTFPLKNRLFMSNMIKNCVYILLWGKISFSLTPDTAQVKQFIDHLIRGHKDLLPILNELQTNDDEKITAQYFFGNCMSYYYGS